MPEIQWHIGGTGSPAQQFFVADVSIATVIGGAGRVLFEQGTLLRERRYDVYILTPKCYKRIIFVRIIKLTIIKSLGHK